MATPVRTSKLETLTVIAGFILVALNIMAAGQHYAWFLELTVHFRPQYALAAATLVIVFACFSAWRWVFVMLVVLGLNSWFVAQHYIESEPPWALETQPSDQMILFNINRDRRDFQRLADRLINSQATLIILQEYGPNAEAALPEKLFATYPFQMRLPAENHFGMAVFSRAPLTPLTADPLVDDRVKSLRFTATLPHSGTVTITAVHPPSPMSRGDARMRNNELIEAASWVASQVSPQILLGDFNATPYSHVYQTILTQTGLRPLRPTQPFDLASWPDFMGTDLMRLAIDHVLISDDLAFHKLEKTFGHGSDHAMISLSLQGR
ncbi:MAG: endonuclease/exonuclease/phosphatase family protein [Pseudomonadota bacterium]